MMDKLYTDIGDKLKMLAKICGTVGIACGVIGILVMVVTGFDDESVILGLVSIVSGIITLVSSWPLYAFGQLVNDVSIIKNKAPKEETVEAFELPEI